MAKSSSRTGEGDPGRRNTILLVASVLILAAAGGWFYMSRPKNLDEQMKEQLQAKRAEHPQPAKAAEDTGAVEMPKDGEATAEGAKTEGAAETAEQPAEEAASAPKKPKRPKTGAVP